MSESHTNVEGNTPLNNETPHTTISEISLQSSPYYLHSADHPGAVLGSTPLTGDNYITWKRAMKMALNAKKNLVL
jgi:predicted YcjX-like family ATPase